MNRGGRREQRWHRVAQGGTRQKQMEAKCKRDDQRKQAADTRDRSRSAFHLDVVQPRLRGTASSWRTILGRPSSRRHRPSLRTGSCEPTVSASGEHWGPISRSRQTCSRDPACCVAGTTRALLGRVLLLRESKHPPEYFSAALRTRESSGRSARGRRACATAVCDSRPRRRIGRAPAGAGAARPVLGRGARRGLGGLRGARRAGAGGARSARRAGAHRDASDQRAEQEDGHEEPGGRWLRGRRVGVNR